METEEDDTTTVPKLPENENNKESFKKPKILIDPNRGRSLLHKYKQQKQLVKDISQEAGNEGDIRLKEEDTEEHTKENLTKKQEEKNEKVPKEVAFPYTEPTWSSISDQSYSLEELKSGVIERTVDLSDRAFTVFGRMDGCHLLMAHPSVSRHHAVLQFGVKGDETDANMGFYIYDLGSTHGTFVNKNRVKPRVFTRVRVGHMLKIGCSSRLFILRGPVDDEEAESEFSVTELKERRRLQEEERKAKEERAEMEAKLEEEKRQKLIEERGIDWGMCEDADEETDLSENPFAITTNEDLYIDDPKKTLRGWFEREGEELTYDVQKADKGMFVCKIVLPLDTETGRDIVIEISGKSKKEATVKCSLEACRHIDRLGLLRQSHHESRKRQAKNWEENDYYDSDDDNFLDRTGQIEKKREIRMMKFGRVQDTVETYESLLTKHKEVINALQKAEDKLHSLNVTIKEEKMETDTDVDALDAFMENLAQINKRDKLEIKLCKQNIEELKKEEAKLRHFVNVAKPANLPDLKPFIPKNPADKMAAKLLSAKETIEPPPEENGTTHRTKSDMVNFLQSGDTEINANTEKGQRIGPQIPCEQIQEKKKKRSRQRVQKSQKPEMLPNSTYDDGGDDFNNCVWMPPKGQTGDGRTSLNEKLGY